MPPFPAAPGAGRVVAGVRGAMPPFPAAPRARQPVAVPRRATPRARWASAVAAEPLETPRPLPSRLAPLARTLGVRGTPRFTSGPRTRRALGAAGALGATTGSVVHLSRLPLGEGSDESDPAAAVLRHELSHAARPVSRPRFLIQGAQGGDGDERVARRAQVSVRHAVVGAQVRGPTVSSGVLSALPIAGPGAAPASAALSPVRTPDLDALARAALVHHADRSPGAAPSAAATTGFVVARAPESAAAPGARTADGGGASGASGGVAGAGTGGAAGPAAAVEAPHPPDMDAIMDAIGDRLLREIERRGGRWSETF